MDLSFVRIVRVGRERRAFGIWILGLGAPEYQVLAVGTPERAQLYVARVRGARQRLQPAARPVVPGQDAAGWIKDLEEAVVFEVRDIIAVRHLLVGGQC